MALATLSIDLEAKLANFEQGMDKAARLADKRAQEIQEALEGIKAGAAMVGGAIAGAFSVGAIASFIHGTVGAIDALNDVADATGDTIENISGLENVARLTGGTLDQVGSMLVKFNGVLKEAEPDSAMARAIQAIGLSAEDLRRQAPSEALRQVAAALSQYADDGTKARLVQELFGKSVQEAAPFLKDLAEAGQLTATVTKEQADEADRYNKELFQLQTTVGDVARSLTMALVPALNNVTQQMRDEGFLSLFGFGKEFKAKKELAAIASEVIQLNSHLNQLKADQAGGIGYFGNAEKVAAQIANVTRELDTAKKKFREANAAYLGLTDGSAGGGRGFVNPGGGEAGADRAGPGGEAEGRQDAESAHGLGDGPGF
ncbi:hypothetical protein OOT46_29925 [Aquabacterium sp. A7-Y]|uniref:hypothetical protein n=1 Tax=Aquabacterium sp. A7-Y TaxID=1349605 RepID=UPI00223E74C1|nr:hypothetical protein [Aquabacterium sp. A7-Y]MCW7542020.1 hypothetical protein [Aquabacterium sp. A7-Y]